MRAHIDWPEDKNHAPVWIEIGNGAEEILRDGYLTTLLKTHGVQTVGVMLDADTKPKGRYERIRNRCIGIFPSLPESLPETGLIVENDEGLRLGAWIMPDNIADGSLETFLRFLVPDDCAHHWKHATDSVAKARALGCGCRDSHIEKAHLYTWLAWQDPPGQYPGIALTKKILNPNAPSAATFVSWFRELYKL